MSKQQSSILKERFDNFINRCSVVHNNEYDYSNTVYINSTLKVKIICKEHGSFLMRPNSHVNGQGCPTCAKFKQQIGIRKRNNDCILTFIDRAIKIHGSKYDYGQTMYTKINEPVNVKCITHGEFTIKYAWEHLNVGPNCRRCPLCAKEIKRSKLKIHNTYSTKEFINISNIKHNFKYDYEKSVYLNSISPITITCLIHGDFVVQLAASHLNNDQGCPTCTRKMSKGEQQMRHLLELNNINFVYQKIFPDLKSLNSNKLLPFDFWLTNNSVLIEIDGIQHSQRIPFFHTENKFKMQQLHDNIKTQYAINNKITLFRILNTDIKLMQSVISDILNKESIK
jgi:very-short-patch-repair endonuclease